MPSIHPSHTKNNLIDIILLFNFPIKYNHTTKGWLVEDFCNFLYYNRDIELQDNPFNFRDVGEITNYLQEPSPKKTYTISCKERHHLLSISRNISNYIKNGQDIKRTFYKSYQELYSDALYLATMGGDIPTCRRALTIFNNSLPPYEKIEIILSPQVAQTIAYRTKQKLQSRPIFSLKEGTFLVEFD